MTAARRPFPGWLVAGVLLLSTFSVSGAADDPADLERRVAAATGAEKVELLLQLAEARSLQAPDQTVARAQEAYDAATGLSLPLLADRALSIKAKGYFHLGDLDRALETYQAGLKAGEAIPDARVVGACLNGIAIVYLKRGQPDEALRFFDRATAELEKAGDSERLAGVLNNVAVIHYNRGEYALALDWMSRALAKYEALGDEKGQGIVVNAIGTVHGRLGNAKRAEEYFQKALAIAERTKYGGLQVSCLVNLGEAHAREKEWGEARAFNERALVLARELGQKDSIAVCLINLGDVERETGNVDGALKRYGEAMGIVEAMNSPPRLAGLHLSIGELEAKMGRLGPAEESLTKAHMLAGQAQEKRYEMAAARALAGLYERKGDYRRAFDFERAADALNGQLFSRQNMDKVAALETKLATEQKEKEIALLTKQQEIQALEAKRQRLWIAFVMVALVLLGSVAALLLARNRLKERTNAELTIAYSRMEEQARSDALTSLANRRAATERIELERRRTERTHRPLSLVMLDVDDFKKVNDERGHACGDAVLKGLAELLRSTLRQLDLAARWGGEEFLLVLPETSQEGALQIAEKIRRGVEEIRIHDGGKQVSFTVTIGVGTFDDLLDVDACLRRVDAALYEGKRSGKNRVVAA